MNVMRRQYGRRSTQYFVLSTLFLIAAIQPTMCSAAVANEPADFLGRTPEQWLTQIQSKQPEERAEAAWAIAQLAPRDPQLALKLIGSDDASVRYWGVLGLQRAASSADQPDSVRELIRKSLPPALSDKALSVRIAAAETLGLVGDTERALPVLVEAMSHPHDLVRIQAVAALEKLGDDARPAEKTLRDATSDSSEYVKRISARALLKLDSPAK
jgi:HEAT repeat protein